MKSSTTLKRYAPLLTGMSFLAISLGSLHAEDKKPKTLVVAADGSGDFRTVQEAVDAVTAGNTKRLVIRIKPGTYKQRILVPRDRPFISFVGEDAEKTILTFDLNAHSLGPDGKAVGTGGSCSTNVQANDFSAENVTFENSAGNTGQALAISVTGDRAAFRRCRFLGWQDTIYSDYGRQYFRDCYIEGHVDFIFGGATAVFDHCHLHCVGDGFVTAASTGDTKAHGFVFRDCRVTAAEGAKAVHLGRPWRPYASVSFLRTELPAAIVPEGWSNWGNPENEKTARFAEYGSYGPGAKAGGRVPWAKQLGQIEANLITVDRVLGGTDGWNPGPKVQIALVGDSTVTDGAGWGGAFARLLRGDVECINLARGGRSSGSFVAEGSWEQCLELRPDYVLIQFGHNDEPGHGPERETDPETTYRANMARYIKEARASGIKPVLVTSLTRQQFGADAKIHSSLTPYVNVVKEIAADMDVPLVDLHTRSIRLCESLGKESCEAISPPNDGTHLNAKGGELVAPLVADELRKAVPSLGKYINSVPADQERQ